MVRNNGSTYSGMNLSDVSSQIGIGGIWQVPGTQCPGDTARAHAEFLHEFVWVAFDFRDRSSEHPCPSFFGLRKLFGPAIAAAGYSLATVASYRRADYPALEEICRRWNRLGAQVAYKQWGRFPSGPDRREAE